MHAPGSIPRGGMAAPGSTNQQQSVGMSRYGGGMAPIQHGNMHGLGGPNAGRAGMPSNIGMAGGQLGGQARGAVNVGGINQSRSGMGVGLATGNPRMNNVNMNGRGPPGGTGIMQGMANNPMRPLGNMGGMNMLQSGTSQQPGTGYNPSGEILAMINKGQGGQVQGLGGMIKGGGIGSQHLSTSQGGMQPNGPGQQQDSAAEPAPFDMNDFPTLSNRVGGMSLQDSVNAQQQPNLPIQQQQDDIFKRGGTVGPPGSLGNPQGKDSPMQNSEEFPALPGFKGNAPTQQHQQPPHNHNQFNRAHQGGVGGIGYSVQQSSSGGAVGGTGAASSAAADMAAAQQSSSAAGAGGMLYGQSGAGYGRQPWVQSGVAPLSRAGGGAAGAGGAPASAANAPGGQQALSYEQLASQLKQQKQQPQGFQNAPDRFGLLGLLSVIRMTDKDLNTLALGTDLTTLGLNLNSPECLYATFQSPWTDSVTRREPEYTLPLCYYMQPPALKTSHFQKFQLETLFYIFYNMPGDQMQVFSAQELYNREWRYHKQLKLWFTRAPNTEVQMKTQSYERGSYIYFDVHSWDKVRKDNFVLTYDQLEERSNFEKCLQVQQHSAHQPGAAQTPAQQPPLAT